MRGPWIEHAKDDEGDPVIDPPWWHAPGQVAEPDPAREIVEVELLDGTLMLAARANFDGGGCSCCRGFTWGHVRRWRRIEVPECARACQE